ncbi:hypothetical protein [Paramagnetospirillum magnetotacticum]|uniref:hypothetical protein n=1 Tax=Paramagnetospirillum magnetotacticum TaxID=188 RepID=UPI00126A2730|nr:hypothetical protein [Paramagnetospirillum magnetotacticum]
MGQGLDCTCLQGLDLALKWAGRRPDPDLVRSTASIVQDCLHREDCLQRQECDDRLSLVEDWLLEIANGTAEGRAV